MSVVWQSPPIADAHLTYFPEALVTLWAVIAGNRAHQARIQRRRSETARGLMIALPIAFIAALGGWMIWNQLEPPDAVLAFVIGLVLGPRRRRHR